jgi:hypothetical protein
VIDEVQIFGVYVPAALCWASLAILLTYWLRPLLHRLPLSRISWRPALFDIAVFMLLWWGLATLADGHLLPTRFPV